jgi:hypothetical protein
MTLFLIKLLHTLIFFALSSCVLTILYSGARGKLTRWTLISLAAILAEGVVLAANQWRCPLTNVAERMGAQNGSVSDIFLPAWLSDRIFPICGSLFAVGCVAIVVRAITRWVQMRHERAN